MPQIPVPILLLLGLTSLFSAFMAAYAFSRQRLRGAREFGLLVSAISLDAMGYTVEISRTKLADILLAVKFEYMGIAFIASFGLFFALAFTGSSPLRKRTVALFLIQPAITLLVVWTTELHDLFYFEPHLADNGFYTTFGFIRGPWYVFNFAYQIAVSIAALLVLLIYAFRAPEKARRQSFVLIAGSLPPLFGAVAMFADLVPYRLDTTPVAASLSALVYGFVIFRLGLFELVPAARELALDSSREAFFVVDSRGRLQDMNKAARALPGAEGLDEGAPPSSESRLGQILLSLVGAGEGELEFTLGRDGVEQRLFARSWPVAEGPFRAPGTAILVGDVTERARLVQHLTELAETDSLTGILNRRSLMEAGARQFGSEACADQSIGIVMIDLDHFKSVNDKYGHEAGDEVIKAAVERWKTCLRGVDILGRYGGEEFVAILPGADLKGSLATAERLRASLATCPVAAGGREVAMTASFGVHCDAHASFAENLRLADMAMYRAKERGRNRVEGAE